jgi:endoglucanase Acf2
MRARLLAATAGVAVVALLSGCTSAPAPRSSASDSAGATTAPGAVPAVFDDASVASLVKGVPARSIAATPTMRLAAGLVPPTNRWFSGLVFGDQPQPVFPFPLSFAQTETGFSAGLPKATSTTNTIAGGAVPQVSLDVGATGAVVSAYDEVSVTLEHRRGGAVLGHTTIAEGSPLVSYRAASAQRVRLNAPVTADGATRGTIDVAGQRWAVVVSSGSLQGASVSLKADGSVVLLPLPTGASSAVTARLMRAAASPLRSVVTTASASAAGQRTTLAYRTASGAATAVVPLPHQGSKAASGCTTATYATIYGTVPVCIAKRISFTTPTIEPRTELDLSGVSDAQRQQLRRQLRADVASSKPFAADTYFGGKSLYRSAMLLQLARQLGDETSAATLTKRLTTTLDLWTEPGGCTTRKQECFVYDPKLKTVVGLAQSFGSEEGNDHHFHYGYFLYAAGVVAAKDPDLAKRWAPVMDLLAADIASRPADGAGKYFPTSRVYDPYFSHSWASGYSPFADGNNQESSSEAVNAWTGLSQWATASGDKALGAEAAWLLSGETASALAYWVAPKLSGEQFQGFSHRLVSLNWGGKRDFATWFSPKPSAIIGIQLIPMSPVSSYLASEAGGGPEHIRSLVKTAAPDGSAGSFTDYLLMYRSLAGKADAAAALREARTLPDTAIDDGSSRTYLLAYLMANAAG